MSIVDQFPYPWQELLAQQLHRSLYATHPSTQQAILIAQQAGVEAWAINQQQAPMFLWKDVLDTAAAQGVTRDLVSKVRDCLHQNSPVRPFLDDLLANKPLTPTAEVGSVDDPGFVQDDDAITEPEALLFHDDLMIQIGSVTPLIETLKAMVAVAPGVCKLNVSIDGDEQTGSGFRIGEKLILTNWHITHRKDDKQPATAVSAEFEYEHDDQGMAIQAKLVQCDAATVVSDEADDWALVEAKEEMDAAWKAIPISTAVPKVGEPAYIVQHPAGQRKRLAFVRNQISKVTDRVVHYLTDTQAGSSGSPVFNSAGELIALHRAGGRPQTVVGKPPLKKNEGICISRVVQGLKDRGVNVK